MASYQVVVLPAGFVLVPDSVPDGELPAVVLAADLICGLPALGFADGELPGVVLPAGLICGCRYSGSRMANYQASSYQPI